MFTLGYEFQKNYYKDWKFWTGEDLTTHSLFCQDEMDFDPFTLVLGARVDQHNWWGSHVLPSASLLYKLAENIRLKAMVGPGFRSPKLVQIGDVCYEKDGVLLQGNPNLGPEKSLGYQLGTEYEVTKNLLTKVYLFRNDLTDMIERYDTGVKKQGLPIFGFQNVGEVYTQGVEMEVSARFTGGLSGKLGYTFLDSQYKKTGKKLIYTPDHKLHLGFGFKQPDYGLGIDLKGEYIGKRYENKANTKELGDYFLTQLKVNKDILKWLRAYISVKNIFDTKYEEVTGVEMPGREFRGGLSAKF
jgi:outer membrane receptor for ferrienterochelin and colicin